MIDCLPTHGVHGVRAGALLADAIADNLKAPYELKILNPINLEKDRDIIRRAKVVYGVHGGALPMNMMLMQEGTHAIEIVDQLPETMMPYCCQPYHTYSANAMNVNFWLSKPQYWAEWTGDVFADVPDMLSVLRHIGVLRDDADVPDYVLPHFPGASAKIPAFRPTATITEGSGNARFAPLTCASIPMGVAPGPGPATQFDLPPLEQKREW